MDTTHPANSPHSDRSLRDTVSVQVKTKLRWEMQALQTFRTEESMPARWLRRQILLNVDVCLQMSSQLTAWLLGKLEIWEHILLYREAGVV